MDLLAGENVILSSDNNILVLTNYRIRYDSSVIGASRYVGITLDAVSSCGLITRSWPLLLVFAAVAALGGVLWGSSDSVILGLIVGAILVVAYFSSRSAVLSISSNGGEDIVIPAKRLGREKVIRFLQAVEAAKLKQLGVLS